jgi:hypothetical protein
VRSPLVLKCLDDYLAGARLPLEAIYADPSLYDPRPVAAAQVALTEPAPQD